MGMVALPAPPARYQEARGLFRTSHFGFRISSFVLGYTFQQEVRFSLGPNEGENSL